MPAQSTLEQLKHKLRSHLELIYPNENIEAIAARLIDVMCLRYVDTVPPTRKNHWSEKDAWIITYGDSLKKKGKRPLQTLKGFLDKEYEGLINGVHVLPFNPFSSDDGFSVKDYRKVNSELGDWNDLQEISQNYRLMGDLVLNHCSAQSDWFTQFKLDKEPYNKFFYEGDPNADLSEVVRPRTSPLLAEIKTLKGKKHVWCTFSHDQVDLNFANPEVLIEFIAIIKFFVDHGVTVFRLDAVAFLWKEIGTNCIHLPQTHEVVRLMRTLLEHRVPDGVIITETNVPKHENLSYFGNGNEAHGVYNFSLPPMILHALNTGTSKFLQTWQMTMPPAQRGTFYFNFLASHDGIGLRPAEGILSDDEISDLAECMEGFGGKVSWRTVGTSKKPYELNISLFDAFKGTAQGEDAYQVERFLCAHAIMLSLEGVPGIYIHSLLGTENDIEGMKESGMNRRINRHKWDLPKLEAKLEDDELHHKKVFNGMKDLLKIRRAHKAFHPNAVQFTLHVSEDIFAFWRQSEERDQSIFCLHNVTNKAVEVPLTSLNLIDMDQWRDLIAGEAIKDLNGSLIFEPYQCVWLTNK